jgi:hypothetical protein
MKKLFEISQEEKNRILEMHSSNKIVISEQLIIDPKWTKNYPCLNEMGTLINGNDNNVIVRTLDGKDNLSFYKDGRFVYEDDIKKTVNGVWKCVSGKIYIKTNDGLEYTTKTGWVSKSSTPNPSGTVNVPQPKKVVEGMTINLYNEKSETSQPKTHKIFKIIDKGSDGIELQLGDKELSLANPTVVFKCSGGMVMDNPIDTGGQVYNKQLENSLRNQFCQQNKQNITVPKADFAMNNQSTDTATGIA